MPAGSKLPRWNLDSIYPSFDSSQYKQDKEALTQKSEALLVSLEEKIPDSAEEAAGHILKLLHAYEDVGDIAENLEAYVSAVFTCNTRDKQALAEINCLEGLSLPLGKAHIMLQQRFAERRVLLEKLVETDEELKPYAFFIREALFDSEHQLPVEMEDLANDLSRSGADAWSRLHESITSTLSTVWDLDSGEVKTLNELRDLAHQADRNIRRKAYKAELKALKSMEIPLAASINGVKGAAITLDTRRGWKSALEKAAFQSRISPAALEALITVLEEARPLMQRYLKNKAKLLGIPVCTFYDLFAPAGSSSKTWSWEESREFILQRFKEFDPAMAAFAANAYALSWIDAEGREGKVGGAYCTDLPLSGESRILCNYEGSFDSLTTVAHELGHAWHHELVKDLPRTLSAYPMTLAETASTFAETIVFEGALANLPDSERLGLIEGNLKDSCQILVDILSRFYFERSLFERRNQTELTPDELCNLMLDAQKEAYGDGLDPENLHPYMWAVKGHYYRSSLNFYNYPYAFGLLFSLSLYAASKKEGSAFTEKYRELLRLSGRAEAGDVAEVAGFSIEDKDFWRQGVSIIAKRAEEFEKMVKERI